MNKQAPRALQDDPKSKSRASDRAPAPSAENTAPRRQRHFVFVLLNDFTFLPFASALEPLRIANRMSEKTLYRWTVVSESGAPAKCSAGTRIMVDSDLPEIQRDDVVIVCGGIAVSANTTKGVLNWLRKSSRKGAVMGGLCTGAHALAAAGLLDNKRATIHWENRDGFLEQFEETTLTKSVFTIDGNQ